MKEKQKIKTVFLAAVLVLGLIFTSCPQDTENESEFASEPVLTVTPGNGNLECTWTHSSPRADQYTLYFVEGTNKTADQVKAGTRRGSSAGISMTIPNLTNNTTYSVVVTATKSGYREKNSQVRQGKPSPGNFSASPVLTLDNLSATSISCTWTASAPVADSYDIYYTTGTVNNPTTLKTNGTRLQNKNSGSAITGLTTDTTYSVLVTAIKSGLADRDSNVSQIAVKEPGFSGAPGVFLIPSNQSFFCNFSPSVPPADSYDIYYIQGTGLSVTQVKAGTKITGASSGRKIEGLTNDVDYSVVVTANKANYPAGDSDIRTVKPSASVSAASVKRGVGYDFATLRKGVKNNTTFTARDMDLLMSGGVNGIKWFYSWGIKPNATVATEAANRGLVYFPMTWNNSYNEQDIRDIVNNSNPRIEYILAFNEPNFPDQANMMPQAAANAWPKLREIASELNLKIISPAMNFGSLMDPIPWLDEFFSLIGPEAVSEIHGIAVHTYPWWPGAVKGILDGYRKYNKPIWLTEFCGWEDVQSDWRTSSWQMQAWYMSQALVYLEMDPLVERYAWYLPKGHEAENSHPFHNLLTDVPNTATQPELTELGKVYVNMTTLDKTVWVPAGQKIDAAQFINCNLESYIGNSNWPDAANIVLSMPTNDTDKSVGVLDIRYFTQNKWVEYQVNLPSAKAYALTLRYRTAQSTNMSLSVDGAAAGTTTLNSAAWTETTVNLGNLSAGNHTIRLTVTNNNGNGNTSGTASSNAAFYNAGCALNWLKVE